MKRLFFGILLASSLPVMAMGKMPQMEGQSNARPAVASCQIVVQDLNKNKLSRQINETQLVEILQNLNTVRKLPDYFVTKKQAQDLGWRPGSYFSRIPALKGKSIGGDHFGNYERRLPQNSWKEADLDYRGNKRNAKRLVFSTNALQRYVTVDHYETFHQVPPCQ